MNFKSKFYENLISKNEISFIDTENKNIYCVSRDPYPENPITDNDFAATFSSNEKREGFNCYENDYKYISKTFENYIKDYKQYLKTETIFYPISIGYYGKITIGSENDLFDPYAKEFVFIEKKNICKEKKCKRISEKIKTEIQELIRNEVNILSNYYEGNIFCVDIYDFSGNNTDSLNGIGVACISEMETFISDYYETAKLIKLNQYSNFDILLADNVNIVADNNQLVY